MGRKLNFCLWTSNGQPQKKAWTFVGQPVIGLFNTELLQILMEVQLIQAANGDVKILPEGVWIELVDMYGNQRTKENRK